MLWAQSTTRDYVRAGGDFHKKIHSWKNQQGREIRPEEQSEKSESSHGRTSHRTTLYPSHRENKAETLGYVDFFCKTTSGVAKIVQPTEEDSTAHTTPFVSPTVLCVNKREERRETVYTSSVTPLIKSSTLPRSRNGWLAGYYQDTAEKREVNELRGLRWIRPWDPSRKTVFIYGLRGRYTREFVGFV